MDINLFKKVYYPLRVGSDGDFGHVEKEPAGIGPANPQGDRHRVLRVHVQERLEEPTTTLPGMPTLLLFQLPHALHAAQQRRTHPMHTLHV